MPEVFEEQKQERFDLRRYMDIVRRRHIYFLVLLLAGWMIVWGGSWLIPARYKSGTLILVEQPTMPKDYVAPNVSDDLQDRLQSITQQLLSRTRLLVIIDRLKLYGGDHSELTPVEKVELMRKDIDIELVRSTRDDQITAFNIYYSAHDPHVAQQVTGELTNLFINANLEARQQESEDTTNFLESQLENARANLSSQEAKVQAFEGAHTGELPTQQASNLQILSGLQSDLVTEQDALNTAQQQQVYLQALINQYRAAQQPIKASGDTPSRLTSIDQDLDRLKSQLADLRSRYTDRYPDVQKVKDQIARTQKMRDDLVADLKKNNSAGSRSNDAQVTRDELDATQNPTVLQLQGQLQANKAEVANREQAVAGLKAKLDDYQGRLNQEPVREQQLADLTRGYDQSKENYDDLLKKKNESEMATSMEHLQEGERFIMLDPPSLPLKPDFPNRIKFCGIGLLVGIALGSLVVGALEYMDDRLYREEDIENLLPTEMIVEIPEVADPLDMQRNKRRALQGWAAAALVFVIIFAGSAISYLHS
jgi:polysaccharide chain length determinant protein (PEP-CTERM system associated)